MPLIKRICSRGALSAGAVLIASALVVGLVVASGRVADTSADAGLATPTPGGGTGGPQGNPVNARPYFKPIEVAGPAVLHGIAASYDWAPGVPDPSNGATVSQEFWISIDSNGLPDQFVGKYSVGGAVVQTIVQDRTSMTARMVGNIRGQAPGASACKTDSPSTFEALQSTLPQRADTKQLSIANFKHGGAATPPALVLSDPHPGSEVLRAQTADAWQSGSDKPASRAILIDPASGRLLSWHSVSRNSAGTRTAEHSEEFGPLEVIRGKFSLSDVAEQVIAEGPCHE